MIGGNRNRFFPVVYILKIDLGGETVVALEPLLCRDGRVRADGWRVDIFLKDLGSSWDDEGYWFDVGVVDGLVGAHHFVFVRLDGIR